MCAVRVCDDKLCTRDVHSGPLTCLHRSLVQNTAKDTKTAELQYDMEIWRGASCPDDNVRKSIDSRMRPFFGFTSKLTVLAPPPRSWSVLVVVAVVLACVCEVAMGTAASEPLWGQFGSDASHTFRSRGYGPTVLKHRNLFPTAPCSNPDATAIVVGPTGTIFITCPNLAVFAFNPAGQQLWVNYFVPMSIAEFAVDGQNIVYGIGNSFAEGIYTKVWAWNGTTGAYVWGPNIPGCPVDFATVSPLPLMLDDTYMYSSLVFQIDEEPAFSGIGAIDKATGELAWSIQGYLPANNVVTMPPVKVGYLWIMQYGSSYGTPGVLVAVEPSTGPVQVVWNVTEPWWVGGVLLVHPVGLIISLIYDASTYAAFNVSTGALMWANNDLGEYLGLALGNTGTVYGTSSGFVAWAADPVDGGFKWLIPRKAYQPSHAAISVDAKDVLYVLDDNFLLWAISGANGTIMWNTNVDPNCGFGTPVVGQGVIIVGVCLVGPGHLL